MAPHQQKLLDQQMETLPFSSELKGICAENHIHTLSDLLNIEVYFWQTLITVKEQNGNLLVGNGHETK
jgi:hypothetical protein